MKKKKKPPAEPPPPKEKPFVNNPFAGIKKQLGKAAPPPPPAPPPAPAKPAPAPPQRRLSTRPDPSISDEERLFAEAMAGVRPMDRTVAPRSTPDAPPPTPSHPLERRRTSDDAEADAALADLVATAGPFTLEEMGDHTRGLAGGCDRRLLRKLERGDYGVEATLDLHGKHASDARRDLERFLADARKRGKRCVLVVHGRGLHSEGEPVLKSELPAWLSSGPPARLVLAFTSAPPAAGGAGATLVLLRRGT